MAKATVNKKELVEMICHQLKENLHVLKAAAMETYAAATGEESRPENEYDTRALEASYLAGAQAKRVLEIEDALNSYKFLEPKDFKDDMAIGPTALVDLDLNGKKSRIFLVHAGGGLTINYYGQSIQVLSPKSPLGEALVGLKVGDSAVVDKGTQTLEYEIEKIS